MKKRVLTVLCFHTRNFNNKFYRWIFLPLANMVYTRAYVCVRVYVTVVPCSFRSIRLHCKWLFLVRLLQEPSIFTFDIKFHCFDFTIFVNWISFCILLVLLNEMYIVFLEREFLFPFFPFLIFPKIYLSLFRFFFL